MQSINERIAAALSIPQAQVNAAVRLMDEGNTVPFIARYRKEVTGSLDDTQLRDISDKLSSLRNLEKRRGEIEASIELLIQIRENAFAYIHGHEVGGTNPSLLESLASTRMSLLLDVCFNKEVGQDAGLYWSKEEGSLSKLIDNIDEYSVDRISEYEKKSKNRIKDAYSWDHIANEYERIFLGKR